MDVTGTLKCIGRAIPHGRRVFRGWLGSFAESVVSSPALEFKLLLPGLAYGHMTAWTSRRAAGTFCVLDGRSDAHPTGSCTVCAKFAIRAVTALRHGEPHPLCRCLRAGPAHAVEGDG